MLHHLFEAFLDLGLITKQVFCVVLQEPVIDTVDEGAVNRFNIFVSAVSFFAVQVYRRLIKYSLAFLNRLPQILEIEILF